MSKEKDQSTPIVALTSLFELLKAVFGLVISAVSVFISWRDPTIFGLLNVNRAFEDMLKWIALFSISLLALQLFWNWGFWVQPRSKRRLTRRCARIVALLLFVGVPVIAFLFNIVLSVLTNYPQYDGFWIAILVKSAYVVIVAAPVYLLSWLVIYAYPNPQSTSPGES